MISGRAAAAPLLLMLTVCTPPVLHTGREGVREIVRLCGDVAAPAAFEGAGTVLFVSRGERQSGIFDVRYKSGSSMTATFYSPMGAIIGAISTGGDSGVVSIQEQIFRLPLDQPLDSLPFSWAGSITLGALVTALSGKVAYQFDPERLVEKPGNHGRRREFVMENKSMACSVISSADLKNLKRITVSVGTAVPSDKSCSIIYEVFSRARARYITIKVDDRNYFSVRYEKFR